MHIFFAAITVGTLIDLTGSINFGLIGAILFALVALISAVKFGPPLAHWVADRKEAKAREIEPKRTVW